MACTLGFSPATSANTARLRAAATTDLAHLGVHVDGCRNTAASAADISTADAVVRALVVTAREDL
ncbi:hypothetical protein ACOBQX_07680 [Actinokineospora sp. G85]|uniref:hypothetical protein n=1 Tax=Actinokineospora sp. G85 TaxID=3406626 RepID=UPI003C71EDC2